MLMARYLDKLKEDDDERYQEAKLWSDSFIKSYAGNALIKDNVFIFAKNYVAGKGNYLELLRYKAKDKNLTSFAFVLEDNIFVWVNGNQPLCEQIYAFAVELFFVMDYLEKGDEQLLIKGSAPIFSDAETPEERHKRLKRREGEAFARLLLVPKDMLFQQLDIFRIDSSEITINNILTLMDIFAVPYDVIVQRLWEDQYINEKQASVLLSVGKDDLQKVIKRTERALRWNTLDNTVFLGNLWGSFLENLSVIKEYELMPEYRLQQDIDTFDEIQKQLVELEK